MLRRIVFFLMIGITISLGQSALAREVLKGPVYAEVLNVLDGDTLQVSAQIWLDQRLVTKVRLAHIDTPELRAKCPQEKKLAQQAKQSLINLIDNQIVILRNIQFGKYAGRILADVETHQRGNLAQRLIHEGLARPYEGKKRLSWCR